MKISRISIPAAGLLLTCLAVHAHPGETGYWLIQMDRTVVRSRILLPEILLIQALGPYRIEGSDLDEDDLERLKSKATALVSEYFTLEAELPLVKSEADELRLEPGGFLEFVSTYTRPDDARSLNVRSSLHRLTGHEQVMLCRVIGGEPEQFVLDAETATMALKLRGTPEDEGSPRSYRFQSGGPVFIGLLLLPFLILAALGLKLLRG